MTANSFLDLIQFYRVDYSTRAMSVIYDCSIYHREQGRYLQFSVQSLKRLAGIYVNSIESTLDFDGVLINKAVTLVGTNLADIKKASFAPTTKQLIFLDTNQNGAALTTPLNMDYFYGKIKSVYGSATPPL